MRHPFTTQYAFLILVPRLYNIAAEPHKMQDFTQFKNISNAHLLKSLGQQPSLIHLSNFAHTNNKHNEKALTQDSVNTVLLDKTVGPVFKKLNNITSPLKVNRKAPFKSDNMKVAYKQINVMDKSNRKSLKYNIDLGVQQVRNDSNSNVDEFFSQVNVTKHNDSINHQQLSNRSLEINFKSNLLEVGHLNSSFSKEPLLNLITRNISAKSNFTFGYQNHSIKTLKKDQLKNSKVKNKEHKKSEIPHVGSQTVSKKF